jgi:Flp pilus assembly pilin Flp
MKKRLLSLAAVVLVAVAMNAQTVKQEVKKDAKAVGNAVEKVQKQLVKV